MIIRRVARFNEKIYRAVVNLIPQLDGACPLPDREHIKEVLKNRNTFMLVAVTEEGVIAGMLTMASYKIPTGTKFWIDDVIVDSGYRGRKVGLSLLEEAISVARKNGARSVDLTSRPFRHEANSLYKKLGFLKRETNVYRFLFDIEQT